MTLPKHPMSQRMRIYVAGKWEDRERVREVQQYFRASGHVVTVDWTNHDFGPAGVQGTPTDFTTIAIEDLQGVIDADVVVLVLEHPFAYKGAWVEMGAALAGGKPVYVLGTAGDSCIFMNHPLVRRVGGMEEIQFRGGERNVS